MCIRDSVCRTPEKAELVARQLGRLIPVCESDPDKAVFSDGIMVLPVVYTKGLEFDAVLIFDPDKEEYPAVSYTHLDVYKRQA